MQSFKEPEATPQDKEKAEKETDILIQVNDQGINDLQIEKQVLTDQIVHLREQLSQLIRTQKTVVMFDGSTFNPDQSAATQIIQLESYNKIIVDQKDANSRLEARVNEL